LENPEAHMIFGGVSGFIIALLDVAINYGQHF
jgi:hypothetical protein